MTAPIPRDIPDLPALPGRPVLAPSPVPASAVLAPVHRPLAAVYRLLVALAAAAGVTIDLPLRSPGPLPSHFTIQSNILLAPVFTLAARRARTAPPPPPPPPPGAPPLSTTLTGPGLH